MRHNGADGEAFRVRFCSIERQRCAADLASLAKALGRLRLNDKIFHSITRMAAFSSWFLLSAIIIRWSGRMARALEIRLRLSHQRTLESVTENFGALAPILRHPRHRHHRHGHCSSSRSADHAFPHRTLPDMAAQADLHRD